jgi:hypothetical protein
VTGRDRPWTGEDAGLTLVELIVYAAVSALFLGLLAGMFVSGLTAQQQSVARDSATGSANVVSATLSSAIRNATAFRVTGEGTRLDAAVALGEGTIECHAWALVATPGGKEIVHRSGTSGPLPPADASWATLATSVTGSLAHGALFADDGARRLRVGMNIAAGDSTVPFTDGITAQAVPQGAFGCWS